MMKMDILFTFIKFLISIVKLPFQLLLNLFPQRTRIFLSSVDTSIRFNDVEKQIRNILRNKKSAHKKGCEKNKNNKKMTILDVGGGGGAISAFIGRKDFDITVLDKNKTTLKKASKRGLKTVLSDGCNIPFKNNSFDFVVSIASFQCVDKNKRVRFLRELKRVAKIAAIVYTPIDSALAVETKLHKFRQQIYFPDPWLELELSKGLPSISLLKKELKGAKFFGIQNQHVWYCTMLLESIPVLNLFVPGIFYSLFLRYSDNKPPYLAYVIVWKKI